MQQIIASSTLRVPVIIAISLLFLVLPDWGRAQVFIDGPKEGSPNQAMMFRLMSGPTQLSVDQWEQVLNPDRYAGNDYITSFSLHMTITSDGALLATAPAPGRYKIAAIKGNDRWETYVLIRPVAVVADIRGASLSAFEPLDRPYVSDLLAVLKRTGMTWVSLVQTGWIDFDNGNLALQPYCDRCPGAMPLDDLEWLIDEAHRQGFKVNIDLGVWARSQGMLDELQPMLEGTPLHPIPFPGPMDNPLDPTDPALLPVVMQSYKAFALQMAALAQQHNVESVMFGNNTASPNNNLLWTQRSEWTDLVAQVRKFYSGKLWMGFEWTCPSQQASFGDYTGFDGIRAGLSGDIASTPKCTFPLAGSTSPTAGQISQRLAPDVDSWRPFTVSAATGLPIIYTDFYTVNVDGVNFLGSSVFERSGLVQDSGEMVDLFEAAMRSVGQRSNVGIFLWSVGLSRNGFGNSQDTLKQSALVNAVANWWGGDTAYFAPCLVSDPADVLFSETFGRGLCPLEKQDLLLLLGGDWRPTPDPTASENTVLRGTENGFAHIGNIRNSLWNNYLVSLRLRLVSGPDPVGMVHFRVKDEGGWNAYTIHTGRDQLRLFKSVQNQSQLLASYFVPGGTALGRWYQLEVIALGPTIIVRLDGQQVIQFTDQANPRLEGAVALGIYGGGPGPITVDFDDILISTDLTIIPVNCSAAALQAAVDGAQPGDVMWVSGACNENVLVRNDKVRVFLRGDGTATINGVDPNKPALDIRGKAILVDGFTITGGSNRVEVQRGSNAVINNNVIQDAGIALTNAVQSASGHGVVINQLAFAVLTNNTIQSNEGDGVVVKEGAAARIGFNSGNELSTSANTIQMNSGNGITVAGSSSARAVGNDINNNGGHGVQVMSGAQGDFSDNAINNNGGDGINVTQNSSVQLGEDPGLFAPANSGAGNGRFGISCDFGGALDGLIGSLTGAMGAMDIDSSCLSSLSP